MNRQERREARQEAKEAHRAENRKLSIYESVERVIGPRYNRLQSELVYIQAEMRDQWTRMEARIKTLEHEFASFLRRMELEKNHEGRGVDGTAGAPPTEGKPDGQ